MKTRTIGSTTGIGRFDDSFMQRKGSRLCGSDRQTVLAFYVNLSSLTCLINSLLVLS